MKNKLFVNGKLTFMQSECVPRYTFLACRDEGDPLRCDHICKSNKRSLTIGRVMRR